MKKLIDLLFQAHHLKRIQRTGYAFLGPGRESVAEHTFSATFVGWVLSRLEPQVNTLRLITMCLTHDLAEARTGDLNYVQKKYATCHEQQAVNDTAEGLPFADELTGLVSEFNQCKTLEAQLAYDADQISFMLELKALADMGYTPPVRWFESVSARLMTDTGRKLSKEIEKTPWDRWWRKLFD